MGKQSDARFEVFVDVHIYVVLMTASTDDFKVDSEIVLEPKPKGKYMCLGDQSGPS